MGCGKSTLGRRIARRLHVALADTDTLVEQREGASVADIFRYEGEEHFRTLEREALDEAIASGCGVISTGGGLPLWRDNMERMNASGTTLYLRRSAASIARRLSPYGRQKRPRLQGLADDELAAFMERDIAAREPFYNRAQFIIDGDAFSDSEIVDRIQMLLEA